MASDDVPVEVVVVGEHDDRVSVGEMLLVESNERHTRRDVALLDVRIASDDMSTTLDQV